MVLSSAKYKRHNNESGGDLSEDRQNLAEVLAPSTSSSIIISGNNMGRRRDSLVSFEEDLSTTASDQLCTANVADGGGHVRFVDSTVRYHMSPPSFWSRRSGLEKGLLIFSSLVVLFCLILLAMLSSRNMGTAEELKVTGHLHVTSASHPSVCLSPECVKVAATILSDMDMKADPCKDFYQYSCGGWQKLNPIPDGHSSWSMFEKMWEANQLVMKNALEEKIQVNGSKKLPAKKVVTTASSLAADFQQVNKAELKAKMYYESCMDVDGTIESLAGKPVLQLIEKHFGSCPLLQQGKNSSPANQLNSTTFRQKLSILHHDLQSGGFFTWSVGENDRNSTQHVIQIDQGGLTLPTREYYLRENDTVIVEALKKVMFNVVKLLLRDSNPKNETNIDEANEIEIKKQIDDLVAFETKIANMTTPLSKRREESQMYNNLSIVELNEIADFLNWTSYYEDAFARVGRPIKASEEVVLYASRFMSNMSDLVKEHLTTERGRTTLYNYIVWHAVKPLRMALSKDYRDAGKELEKAMLGKDGHQDRWRFCVTDTDSVLGFAVGAMFVRSAFHGESKPSAQAMIDSIKQAFEKRLTKLTWMDEETRTAAIHKARAITDMIGFPEFILDKNQLEEKYHNLTIVANDYFGNNLRSRDYSFIDNMKKLDMPVNRTRWSMTPPTVNAYYTPTKNQIVFPAGILQSPFFNLDYPRSLNYGAMGVVMGHELSHAFDDQGREYDEEGNMRQWWNNVTLNTFKNRTSCMENQYSSYNFMAQNLSGEQTLGENIADNGGLKASYYAYRQWLKEQEFDEEPPLPGLNMTHNQLFFLSFAQVWCSTSTPQANQLQILEDSHSPARFRVIGVLSNTKEFSDVFRCPVGTPMNPKAKCEVW